MARYGFKAIRVGSSTLDVASITTAAASPRRFQIFDFTLGSDASPADNAFLWEISTHTAKDSSGASFGSVVTGVALDSSDTIASTVICLQSAVTNLGAGSTIFGVPLNQRASFRWVASPGSEFVAPATACNGFAIATPTASAVNIEAYTLVNEL